MAPPKKKGYTMDLAEFVGDWAEEDTGPSAQWNQQSSTDLFASVGLATPAQQEVKVPTLPPFTARIGNLSYEAVEDDIKNFFKSQKVSEIRFPKTPDQKSRGYAFVEFFDRDSLVQALALGGSNLNGRSLRVDLEQSSHDNGRRGGRYADEAPMDWSQRRTPQVAPREFREGREGREPREFREPENMDWSQRRGPSQMRGSMARPHSDRPPRQFDEPENIDWSQRRQPTRAPAPQRAPRAFSAPRDEPDLDWSQRRGPSQSKRAGKPSGFDVLKGSEAPADAKAPAPAPTTKDAPKLADTLAAAAATASTAEDDTWTTVKR